MIWGGENVPNERVQDLLQAFNYFIEDNHKGSKDEDLIVKEQWHKFKKIIQQSPLDTAAHQHYADKLKIDTMGIDIKLTKSVQGITSPNRRASQRQVQSKQFQKITLKLVEKMKQNNRKYIK